VFLHDLDNTFFTWCQYFPNIFINVLVKSGNLSVSLCIAKAGTLFNIAGMILIISRKLFLFWKGKKYCVQMFYCTGGMFFTWPWQYLFVLDINIFQDCQDCLHKISQFTSIIVYLECQYIVWYWCNDSDKIRYPLIVSLKRYLSYDIKNIRHVQYVQYNLCIVFLVKK